MICKQCEREIPENARFCQHCGAPAGAETPRRSRLPLIIGAAGVILVLVTLVLALSRPKEEIASLPQVPTPSVSPMRGAITPPPGNLTQGVKTPEPPPQAAVGATVPQQPTPPPPEVVAYLKQLEQIEKERRAVATDINAGMVMYVAAQAKAYGLDFDPFPSGRTKSPDEAISKGYDQFLARGMAIAQKIRMIPPPKGCETLSATYTQAAGVLPAVVNQLKGVIERKDLTTAYQLMGTVSTRQAEALKRADEELANVCKTYNIPKSFSIQD